MPFIVCIYVKTWPNFDHSSETCITGTNPGDVIRTTIFCGVPENSATKTHSLLETIQYDK